MAGNVPWTDDELAYLAAHGITGYLERYPGYRSYDAVRVKHGVLRKGGGAASAAPPHVPGRTGPLRDVRTASGTPEPEPPTIIGQTAADPHDPEAIRQAAEARFAAAAKRRATQRRQSVHFRHGPVALIFVGDQHIGSPGTNVRRMYEEQELIRATPGAYVCLTGDVVDNYVIGKLTAQNMTHGMTVPEEWALARHYVAGFGDRLVAVSSGNHPGWTQRLVGLDYDREITPAGVLYDTDDLLFEVHVGPHVRTVRMRHKWQGSSIYNPTHAMERAARFDNADPDVFVGAHIHVGAVCREFILHGRRKLALLSSTYKEIDPYQRAEGFADNDGSTAVALVINQDGSFFGTSSLASVLAYMRGVYRGAA